MGTYTIHKCVLLDERSLNHYVAEPQDEFDTLCEYIRDAISVPIGCMDDMGPVIDIAGIVSERFDTAINTAEYRDPIFIRDNWHNSVREIALLLGSIQPDALSKFMKDGDQAALIGNQHSAITKAIDEGKYEKARFLCQGVENLADAGLPGIRHSAYMTCGGDYDAYDLRDTDYGPGRRLLIEYTLGWP